ncbi:uncharacterized protein LOC102810289 isoform X2 [Saccoglossus kowalevskii]
MSAETQIQHLANMSTFGHTHFCYSGRTSMDTHNIAGNCPCPPPYKSLLSPPPLFNCRNTELPTPTEPTDEFPIPTPTEPTDECVLIIVIIIAIVVVALVVTGVLLYRRYIRRRSKKETEKQVSDDIKSSQCHDVQDEGFIQLEIQDNDVKHAIINTDTPNKNDIKFGIINNETSNGNCVKYTVADGNIPNEYVNVEPLKEQTK